MENTLWYEITTSTGTVLLNFSQCSRILPDGSTGLTVYDGAGGLSYTMSSTAERDEVYDKIKRILDARNINSLSPQMD